MKYKDYYQILGVARDASQDEIKLAYRKLARKYHPDVSKEPDAEAKFKEVSEAYEALRDPERRKAYDQFGHQYRAGDQFRPPPGWDRGFGFGSGEGGFGDFSDFFQAIFGDADRRGGAFRETWGRQTSEDQHTKIDISLEEAFRGTTRQISIKTPTGTRKISVKIPAGVQAGQKIRVPRQGQRGPGSGHAGSLYLEIELRPHPWFQVDGRDVRLDLPLTPWEAALGATIKIPTLGGSVELKIPPGSQSGQKLRLKGRGLPGKPAGDQYVILQIHTPYPKNDKERGIYEAMAEEMPLNPRSGWS